MYLKTKLVFLILLPMALGISAQNYRNSPFTRYGLGNLETANNVETISIGGVGLSMRDNLSVNHSNPASYTAFDSLSFLFSLNTNCYYNKLSQAGSSATSNNFAFNGLSFGFLATNWLGIGVSLLPYSTVSYSISEEQTIPELNEVYKNTYTGQGGLNQLQIGFGIEPFKEFSLGINTSYLFGTNKYNYKQIFENTTNFNEVWIQKSIFAQSLLFDFGAQYYHKFKSDKTISVGFSISNESKMKLTTESFTSNYTPSSVVEFDNVIENSVVDTTLNNNALLPKRMQLGIGYCQKNKFKIGVDYIIQDWTKYRFNGQADNNLGNSAKISFGAEYIPNIDGTQYLEKVAYRIGAFSSKTYIKLNENQIEKQALTTGLGLPVKLFNHKRLGKYYGTILNLGFEYGTTKSGGTNTLKENYGTVYIGLTFKDSWFEKVKIW